MLNWVNDNKLDPLLRIYYSALDSVSGSKAVERAIQGHDAEQVFLVAVGKAAGAMVEGALNVLGERLIDGLVISKYGHISQQLQTNNRLQCIESAHPVPDQNSLRAGRILQDYLRKLPASADLLFLVSGGASSLVESLPAGVSLQDLMRVNEHLLGAGLNIGEMNQVRKSLSEIKGGRLAGSLRNRKTVQLLVSDVPGDDLEAIGSGLLIPATQENTVAEFDLPAWLRELLQQNSDAPAASDPVWSTITTRIVASNTIAKAAAATYIKSMGLRVCLDQGNLDGDVNLMAREIADTIKHPDSQPGLYIWGGETTVVLPSDPGRGGRNQQLALQLAVNLKDISGWQILSCGTDGSDGPTQDAGALIDDQQFRMAEKNSELNAQDSLMRADAGSYLEQAGALIRTGPTGTNVMDLVIVRKH